jgi:hypothetical protein
MEVYEALSKMDPVKRQGVIKAMATRLWEDARITGRMSKPSPGQSTAKDALWRIRKFANADNQKIIDKYLNEWLTGGYYEGRAQFGMVKGAAVVRALGSLAAPGLIDAANAIIAAPTDKDGRRPRFGKHLLLGLAACGDTKAVGKLLTAVDMQKKLGDATLRKRAYFALYQAYVEPDGFPKANGKALVPYLAKIEQVVRNEDDPDIIDAALPLLQAAGMPECLSPLLGLIKDPPSNPRFRWIGAQRALLCGGVQSVKKVVEAFPTGGGYTKGRLVGSVWNYIVKMKPPAKVAAIARELLSSSSWVARITGVEVLGMLKHAPTAAKDAEAVLALQKDKTLLRGWWGDQSDTPRKKRKKTPRLGERAAAVGQGLQELAKGATK